MKLFFLSITLFSSFAIAQNKLGNTSIDVRSIYLQNADWGNGTQYTLMFTQKVASSLWLMGNLDQIARFKLADFNLEAGLHYDFSPTWGMEGFIGVGDEPTNLFPRKTLRGAFFFPVYGTLTGTAGYRDRNFSSGRMTEISADIIWATQLGPLVSLGVVAENSSNSTTKVKGSNTQSRLKVSYKSAMGGMLWLSYADGKKAFIVGNPPDLLNKNSQLTVMGGQIGLLPQWFLMLEFSSEKFTDGTANETATALGVKADF